MAEIISDLTDRPLTITTEDGRELAYESTGDPDGVAGVFNPRHTWRSCRY